MLDFQIAFIKLFFQWVGELLLSCLHTLRNFNRAKRLLRKQLASVMKKKKKACLYLMLSGNFEVRTTEKIEELFLLLC